jgi:hypothetical protein
MMAPGWKRQRDTNSVCFPAWHGHFRVTTGAKAQLRNPPLGGFGRPNRQVPGAGESRH